MLSSKLRLWPTSLQNYLLLEPRYSHLKFVRRIKPILKIFFLFFTQIIYLIMLILAPTELCVHGSGGFILQGFFGHFGVSVLGVFLEVILGAGWCCVAKVLSKILIVFARNSGKAKMWYLISGIWYQVSSIWYLVSGIRYLVSSIWYQVSGIWCLVSSIQYLVSGIWYLVAGSWQLVSGIWNLSKNDCVNNKSPSLILMYQMLI